MSKVMESSSSGPTPASGSWLYQWLPLCINFKQFTSLLQPQFTHLCNGDSYQRLGRSGKGGEDEVRCTLCHSALAHSVEGGS